MTSKWKTRGEQMLATIPAEDKTRTCCNCCHIKTGTVCLGLIELVVVSLFLAGIAQQLKWKRSDASFCFKRMWRDCLLFNFHHFNLTLAGDYMMLLVMLLVIVSILLLFCGICSVSPRMLLPHLVIQAIALICSAGYFFLYAWSYFYGDLYTQNQPFQMQSFVERMWLATVVLILSAFQFYLFFTVIKCVLYLQKMRTERNRRKRQFMECSNRVRMAKENGMWRQTSWGGGFQQYKGQYDESKQQSAKKKDKPASHVKWDLRKNTEKSISCVRDIGNPGFEEAPESPKHKPSEEAPVKVVHKHTPRHHSPVSVKKSDSPHHSPKRKPTSSEPKSSVESSRDHRKLQRTDDKTIGGYVGKTAVSGPASPVRRTSVDSNGPLVKPKQNSAVASATKTKQLPRQTSTSSSGGSRKSPEKPSTHHHSSSHRHSEGNAGGGSSASKPKHSSGGGGNGTTMVKKISITSSVPPVIPFQSA